MTLQVSHRPLLHVFDGYFLKAFSKSIYTARSQPTIINFAVTSHKAHIPQRETLLVLADRQACPLSAGKPKKKSFIISTGTQLLNAHPAELKAITACVLFVLRLSPPPVTLVTRVHHSPLYVYIHGPTADSVQ